MTDPTPLASDTQSMATECQMLGCQRAVADKLIQELRAQNDALKAECAHYRRELRNLSAAAYVALKVTKS